MTHRYYYDDPLDAAWMAKHFGMKIGYAQDHPIYPFVTIEDTSEAGLLFSDAGGQYFIHPDSEHILRPQVGDLIRDRGFLHDKNHPIIELVEEVGDHYPGKYVLKHHKNSVLCVFKIEDIEIIQRNGIPFHWPKREGALP